MQEFSASARQSLPGGKKTKKQKTLSLWKGRLTENIGSHNKYLEVAKSASWSPLKTDGGGFRHGLRNALPS